VTLEALVFDVDGTLADTERDGHRVAFNAAFREAGLPWDWDVALYNRLLAVAGGKERIRHFIENHHPREFAAKGIDDRIAALHAAKTRHYTTLLATGALPLRPGVERLLRAARARGIRLAIATTTTPENVDALLRHSLAPDAASWFETIAAGDVVAAKKPAPDVYRLVLDRLGVPASGCVAFEDSEIGLCASLGAGLRTVVTFNDTTRGQDFTGAVSVLETLGEPGSLARVLAGARPRLGYVTIDDLRDWV
jgi:HAD superfamily hydrolase (TIGR01509 family)